jgi:cytochrome b-561 domain-containing protein 2
MKAMSGPLQMGLATMVLMVAAPLLGLVSFRKMGLIQRYSEGTQRWIKALHRQVTAP